ncbi:1-deoxy-D-xylulose-5-phosphate synthase [Spiroplasma alleghenense]|uniref:1-deoxy-D-xylulose-5-phosphate synthase n=1 Tax=Spiroplasma alleghenense TaxID=216931 RepID=A0A345Z3J2_9MOLU|nr:1-deoxy-D-xylulose-5-phosphate synthase [Spiroplasma alleghenense]AXK51171.1 1-deoxy-D-xylulose-5-phosphate synthase [Spiroplasma alleghenense]
MKLINYKNWKDIYKNSIDEIEELINDLRFFLIKHNENNGGHLGSNLGVLEITVGLLNYFKLDETKIIFDTGHQSHFYKLLTGRIEDFANIKKFEGISPFQEIRESQYDHISSGHSSTSLSFALAHKISDLQKNIIAIIGDAALLNGVAFEGLINIANQSEKIIIIYNDNGHGIGENKLKIKDSENFFKSLNLEYVFCQNGNNIVDVLNAIKKASQFEKTTVIHFKTEKSFGYDHNNSRTANHNISLIEDKSKKNLDVIINKFYEKNINSDKSIKLISPGMIESNLLFDLKSKFPKNVIDVGINEEHAVLLAAGLAINNQKPVVSIYSTFFQRTFDQLIHDVIRNSLAVTFLIEKVGLSIGNGVSHHGIYDLSMCQNIENKIIVQPRNEFELNRVLEISKENNLSPFFIRLENFVKENNHQKDNFDIGKYESVLYDENNENTIITYGENCNIFEKIIRENEFPINLINARWLHTIDEKSVEKVKNTKIYVYEHVIYNGSLASLFKKLNIQIIDLNFKKNKIGHGDMESLLKENNLWYNDVIKYILN